MAFVIEDCAYYTDKEYAEMRGCKSSTLEAERSRGTGCPFIKDGARVLYAGRAIREHWESNQYLHGAAHKASKLANSPAARQAAALAESPAVQAACRTAADAVAPRRGRRAAR